MKKILEHCGQILRSSDGFTLIEAVMVIVVIGIAIPSLMGLVSSSLIGTGNSSKLSRAVFVAQEQMEVIKADKSNPTRGYAWIAAAGRYATENVGDGFTRSVSVDTSDNTHNGVDYALVEVTVSHADIDDIVLKTWLTDY
jgi:prepilin-type N-terminal cleavage/methylation domain-containing protein